ncbi:MAG: type B DNA-directed DNA polymerase [Candidatus Nanohaloarchaea archaeon]
MFKVDFLGGQVLEWQKNGSGAEYRKVKDYHPTIYVEAGETELQDIRLEMTPSSKIVSTSFESWKTSLSDNSGKRVLRLDIETVDDVRDVAYRIQKEYPRYDLRFYNVDMSPQFRYCLENQKEPVPERELNSLELHLSEESFADQDITELKFEGKSLGKTAEETLETLQSRLEEVDPDVLILSNGGLVPLLVDTADDLGVDLTLGRLSGYQQLAGENTFESYGRVGHSPARYNVPGRAIIDKSNSFFWGVTSLEGIMDLVERSWKPIQETAWASIGNVLTAIEIRKALLEKDVLIPWNKWSPENFKAVETLHSADRGGFIFQPKTGFHENVHELDFSSLYPNIMVEKNISPETVQCECCEDEKVPGLDYSVCEEEGFIPEVLRPLVEDRAEIKDRIEEVEDEKLEQELKSRSSAIKWILVSCFGYQGYRNAKFGRIECHEAINAYAREIMLEAKEVFEENGYEVIHGIIDSIWVKKTEEDAADVEELAREVSEKVDIELEHERDYDWIAFVPKRQSASGALTRYFGKHGDEFKVRGVELRQRSTCDYIKQCQELLMKTLDKHREPEKVIEVLKKQLVELNSGGIKPEDLVISKRATKSLEEYQQNNRTVAALKRYRDHGIEKGPGEDVEYVVVDDNRKDRDRVRLPFEDIDRYDEEFYTDQLIRATESILSPLGWKRDRIRAYLRNSNTVGIQAFV